MMEVILFLLKKAETFLFLLFPFIFFFVLFQNFCLIYFVVISTIFTKIGDFFNNMRIGDFPKTWSELYQ